MTTEQWWPTIIGAGRAQVPDPEPGGREPVLGAAEPIVTGAASGAGGPEPLSGGRGLATVLTLPSRRQRVVNGEPTHLTCRPRHPAGVGGGSGADDAPARTQPRDRRRRRPWRRGLPDAGMATAEYAVVLLAAVGFAGLLIVILSSDEVRGMLTGLIRDALTV